MATRTTKDELRTDSAAVCSVVDICVNITNRAFNRNWREVVQRAVETGVEKIILTGTSASQSSQGLHMAQQWLDETATANLFCTVGVHPHDAKTFGKDTSMKLKKLLQHPLAVAVGECGLDYNRNFSSKQDQLYAFREQTILACRLQLPMFVHEREAHEDLIKVLDEVEADETVPPLPPIVVHCFTGTEYEVRAYIDRGFYIGFTGTICKKERGAPLRKMLPKIPLNRIMIETDAPFMGFKKGRRSSEPADVVDVARKLSETINVPFEEVCEATTGNSVTFFRLP